MTEGERDTERNRHTHTGDRETEGGGEQAMLLVLQM